MKKIILLFIVLCTLQTRAQFCFTPGFSNTGVGTPYAVCSADFDKDGFPDLAVADGSANVHLFKATGGGSFSLSNVQSVGNTPEGMITADFNSDGNPDLAVACINSNALYILLGQGNGFFTVLSTTVGGGPKDLTTGDFDGDGDLDIVTCNANANTITILIGNNTGNFSVASSYSTSGSGPFGICSADFTGDGKLDVVTANNTSGNMSLFGGTGSATFFAATTFGGSLSGVFSAVAADVNNDGIKDVVSAVTNSNNIAVLLCNGGGSFSSALYPIGGGSGGPRYAIAADFNSDGNIDLASANFASNNITILPGPFFTAPYTQGVSGSNGVRWITSGDFNLDGMTDLAVTGNTNGGLSVLFNNAVNLGYTGNTTICTGSSTTLTGTGASSYTWSPGSVVSPTVSVNPVTNTSYTLSGSNSGCATVPTLVLTVTVNPVPNITPMAQGPTNICQGDTAKLVVYGDPGTTNIWTPGPISGTLIAVTPTTNITYTITETFTATGCSTTNTSPAISVKTSPTVTVSATATVVCLGTPVTLTAGGNATTYTWTNGVTNGVAFTPSGTNTYTVTGTGSNGCTKSVSKQVTVNPLPVVNANATATLVCNGTPITLTASGTATSYTWSGGITNGVPFPANSQTYTLTGLDGNNCVNTATISITAPAATAPNICQVTVDSLSHNNLVYWDKTLYPNADSFYVYRDTANNNYVQIAAQPYSALSQYIDTTRHTGAVNGDPNITTYRYKLAYRDTCGTMSPMSPYHNTIYQYNIGSLFLWNQYQIEGQSTPVPGLSNYVLKRDNAGGTGIYVTAATAGASSTSINDPQYSTYQLTADWRVETVWNIVCTPSLRQGGNSTQATVVKSKSNITNNRTTHVNMAEKLFTVYPNPTNGTLNLDFNYNVMGMFTVKVFSSVGEEVYRQDFVSAAENEQIDLNNLPNGMYLLQVITGNGTSVKRIIKH